MDEQAPVELILASGSATRLAMLRDAGLAVAARPAAVDEAAIKQAARAEGASATDAALLLAEMKAARIAARAPAALVIGADQILVCDGQWFDKPLDVAAARAQLLALRGRSHTLVTAVLCQRGAARIWHHVAEPRLAMREFSEAFLDAYLAAEGARVTEGPGAYRMEGRGAQLFDRVEGDIFAVLGLPLLPLLGFLRQHGALAV
jgi:septum formation protein